MGFIKDFFDTSNKKNDTTQDKKTGNQFFSETLNEIMKESKHSPAPSKDESLKEYGRNELIKNGGTQVKNANIEDQLPTAVKNIIARSRGAGKRFFTPIEEHETRVYHTDWGHRDYDISKIQLRTMYNERKTGEMSDDFKRIITDNFRVRNLSDAARDFGFYSTFIVGDQHTYFVYGIDNEYINTTEFVEHKGRLFPYEFVKENGYSYSEYFHCFKWNAINIDAFLDDRGYEYDKFSKIIYMTMQDMEFLLKSYTNYGLDVPEYVFWEQSTVNYLHTCDAVVANPKQNGTIKNHYANVAVATLKDIAVWCYPAKKDYSIGYLAFILGTRYNVFSGRKDSRNIYKSVNKSWDDFLIKAEDTNPKAFLDSSFIPHEAEFILKEMKERWVYCRVVETESDITKKEREAAFDSLMMSDETKDSLTSKLVTLRYCAFDKGLVEYLAEEYTEQILAKECMDYGDELVKELDSDEMAAVTSHTGVGMIVVHYSELDTIIGNALQYHINLGHPRAWRFRMPFHEGIVFLCQYHDIPLLLDAGVYGTEHRACSMTNSLFESRMRTPAYNGKVWLYEMSYQSGKVHPIPYSNYTNYLIDRGFLVSNDGMDIPVPDDITLKEHT